MKQSIAFGAEFIAVNCQTFHFRMLILVNFASRPNLQILMHASNKNDLDNMNMGEKMQNDNAIKFRRVAKLAYKQI